MEVIGKSKVVALSYVLHDTSLDGEVIEATREGQPLKFIFGLGQLLPDFEKNIDGKKVGDKFGFAITAENGYGKYNEEAVMALDKNIFIVDGKLVDEVKVGGMVPMQDNQGNHLHGKVLEINDDKVVLDFNHPMAGRNLYFEGEILEVRDATDSELDHGHVH